ncbi:DNA-binding transcriptional MocR family regulator [Kineosphaera limosa]|uniref:aminotransferase-like domain-containing protein n=1 Tax=Kineosphaera limosa TaxID=111564 RepID=UPI00058B04F6|nr:PLP-dependent aminotransferase family protein [Kineosphaera limosa]NYE02153.1 DNA-binding transcriptional MocR family regulator [Kineosphaera limosa]
MNDSSSSVELAATLATEIDPLPAGSRIPTHRELVRRFEVSATTVSQALALLTQRGLVESRPGAGTFRTATRPAPAVGDTSWQEAALAPTPGIDHGARSFGGAAMLGTLSSPGPEVADLNGGYLHPDLQPIGSLGSALARAARRPAAWDRPPVGGLPELRDWFAADIGGGLGRHDVLVCGAGQGAMGTVLRALGQPGDPVIVETPTYPGTIAAVHATGLRPIPVPIDTHGPVPEYLEEAVARTRARIIVTQPLFQNPTGACTTPQRQRELLRIARSHGAFIVEDDYARHMRHTDTPTLPPPLIADDPDGVVIHIRSLTKVTSPNLRVGGLAARGPVMARLRAAHIIDTMFVPAPLQFTALEVVTAPAWRRNLATLAAALTHRRTVAVDAVREVFGPHALPLRPRGGYHLWLRLPAHLEAGQFAAAALSAGVALTPGTSYSPSGEPSPHLRISYVATPSAADIGDAIRRLRPLLAGELT